ncbi:MAG: hypothetical protein F4Z57_02135 [Gemmatimonadetes bacterium]|nr:hypothetical protein [Gemmatimonadota bacterium]MYC71352.1 hypothetical protein [Gemmatimonadota bacterium]MYI62851.1 hypothetical protein [Gemmatimonadota bacterium]
MPSKIWRLDPLEAYERPYEYAVQDQFQREATKLLPELYPLLNNKNNEYRVDDQSASKACWLLAMEALDCLRESLAALEQKRHRVFSALLRTTHEVLDLATYFHAQGETENGAKQLKKWYRDEFIEHKVYRNWIEVRDGPTARKRETDKYRSLSRFTHRSYRTLLHGYSVGVGDRLVHDATAELYGESAGSRTMLVLPHTMALYFSALAQSILRFVTDVGDLALATPEALNRAMQDSLEPESEPWRFTTPQEIYERHLESLESQLEAEDDPATTVDE